MATLHYGEDVTTKGSLEIKLGGSVGRPATTNSKVICERTLSLSRAEFVEAVLPSTNSGNRLSSYEKAQNPRTKTSSGIQVIFGWLK